MTAVAMAKDVGGGDTTARFRPAGLDFSNFKPKHFLWKVDGKVATITLNRPERKIRLRSSPTPSCAICSATSPMRTTSRIS